MKSERKTLTTLILMSFALLVGFFLITGPTKADVSSIAPDANWEELRNRVDFQVTHFPGVAGVYIKDIKHGWVIQHNTQRQFPSASLVKLPLMAALYVAQNEGRLSLDEELAIQRRLKAGGSGHLKYARSGTRLPIRELIYRMITESDNTATNILTDYLGLAYYNASFNKFGLSQTNMARMIMDLRQRNRGVENYTTPEDMARMLQLIYERRISGSDEMLAILREQKIKDRLGLTTPSEWILCNKTGLMNNTCHDVGLVFAPSGDYIICVLTENIRNFRRAKGFISEIAHLTAHYYGESAAAYQPSSYSDSTKQNL